MLANDYMGSGLQHLDQHYSKQIYSDYFGILQQEKPDPTCCPYQQVISAVCDSSLLKQDSAMTAMRTIFVSAMVSVPMSLNHQGLLSKGPVCDWPHAHLISGPIAGSARHTIAATYDDHIFKDKTCYYNPCWPAALPSLMRM